MAKKVFENDKDYKNVCKLVDLLADGTNPPKGQGGLDESSKMLYGRATVDNWYIPDYKVESSPYPLPGKVPAATSYVQVDEGNGRKESGKRHGIRKH